LGAASEVLGVPVGAAVPLQRRHPALVTVASAAELIALVLLVVTGQFIAFAGLVVLAVVLVILAASNSHRLLAITANGIVVLAASAKGRPLTAIGPAPAGLSLPAPAGLAAPVDIAGRIWWVEPAAFVHLRQARELLTTDLDAGGSATEG
jgi:hypothetical protein